jgi:hypothetical protein
LIQLVVACADCAVSGETIAVPDEAVTGVIVMIFTGAPLSFFAATVAVAEPEPFDGDLPLELLPQPASTEPAMTADATSTGPRPRTTATRRRILSPPDRR